MDAELRVLVAIARALPRWKGAGRVAAWLRRWYLRRPRSPVETETSGVRMRLDPAQFVDGWLIFGPQFYEADEIRELMSLVREGDVFVDVGAHVGMYALRAARRVGPRGLVVAIEPDPSSAAELRHNVGLNALDNVRVVQAAAAGAAGRRVLAQIVATNRAGASLLSVGRDPVEVEIEVEAMTLAQILDGLGVTRVAAMKLDIEGAEHEVLERYLADTPPARWPVVVMTERHDRLASRAGDVLALLGRSSYREHARFGTNFLFRRSE